MKYYRAAGLIGMIVWLSISYANNNDKSISIGSKAFTESVILADIATQLAQNKGIDATHKRELGGTRVLWSALFKGEIDIYPEYTGTLRQDILADVKLTTTDAMINELHRQGIGMSAPLGFNNTYALGVRTEQAESLDIRNISDLKKHPELRLGFSNEFINRSDGWPGLRDAYSLLQKDVRGLDHNLAYRGLENNSLDVIDLYRTDAEIEYYHLTVLEDDANYFPEYAAVYLYREDLRQRVPAVIEVLEKLQNRISSGTMAAMNADVKLKRIADEQVAADFLSKEFGLETNVQKSDWLSDFWLYTWEHLILVGISLSAAIVVAIPLGILAARRRRIGQWILALTGLIQTLPSLALFVFMIPLLGIGGPPAVMALFLYSLLPIVRNTYAGISGIPAHIGESAEALGLTSIAQLKLVELPMAMPTILAGIKTSAVINIGTATLGALIGAGGYGQPILTGIRLDDTGLILSGAVPAACLALLAQGFFEWLERWLVPKGLRL